jgi:hypothetical protein
VARLVEAINSGNPEVRRGLLHPRTRRCSTGGAAPMWEHTVRRQALRAIPPDHKWKMTPVRAGQPLMFSEQFDYPVRPTHQLQLDYESEPMRSTTVIVQVAREEGRWYEITACPKPATIAAAKAAREAEAKRMERVQALVASASPELRETVSRMYQDGRRIDAIKHYAGATGEDLTTAKDVVERLAARPR